MTSPRPASPAAPTKRRSPNRERLLARVAVWTVALSGVAFIAPHVLF